jgi:truncated hemoglobin YjbI
MIENGYDVNEHERIKHIYKTSCKNMTEHCQQYFSYFLTNTFRQRGDGYQQMKLLPCII